MQEFVLIALLACIGWVSCGSAEVHHTHATEEQMKMDEKCLKDNGLETHPDFNKGIAGLTNNDKCYMKCVAVAFWVGNEKPMVEEYTQNNEAAIVAKLKVKLDDCKKMLVDESCDTYAKTFLCVRDAWMSESKA